MSWICPKCGINNVNANKRCARHNCNVVKTHDSPDEFDALCQEVRLFESRCEINQYQRQTIPEINVVNIIAAIFIHNRQTNIEGYNMTPQEELFSQLFNHEKLLVKNMEILELRAHREELAKIAFEARARLTAVDDEERGRKKKNGEIKGFERSLNTDETSTNAINTIKDRQKRMSKTEKIQAGLEKLGISTADAAKLMSAGTILGRIKNAKGLIESKIETTENKPIFNPFEKKEG